MSRCASFSPYPIPHIHQMIASIVFILPLYSVLFVLLDQCLLVPHIDLFGFALLEVIHLGVPAFIATAV